MLHLLRTKTIIPPARPKRVERVRLVARLREGMLRALTLVAAPAGFGKTTLVAEWARGGEMPVAWLSLEPADRAPERFLSYLVQAFQQVDVRIGQTALALLHGGQEASVETILLSLINDLSEFLHEVACVLDDYHSVDSAEIGQIVQFLLDHRPGGLHLALTSRSAPALALARLRAQDQVVEITAADLRFTATEMHAFLDQVMGARLSADQFASLAQSTEGWAVGLQLAGLALVRQPAEVGAPALLMAEGRWTGPIFDYLASEVLRREPLDVQEFLKVSALFDRFCAPLCEHLLAAFVDRPAANGGGLEAAESLIAYVERANLFLIPLDSAGVWFRYHALFADFLRKQLAPAQGLSFYRAASLWFEQNDLIDDAIHYATQARDEARAAALIEAHYRDLLLRGEQAALLNWVEALPAEMVAARPRLSLAKAWAGTINFDIDLASAAAQQAERSLPPDETSAALRGELKAQRLLMSVFQGQTPAASEFTQAFSLLAEQDDFLHSLLHFNQGLSHAIMAETAPALAAFSEAVRLSEKLHNHLVLIAAGTQLGEQYQIHGDLALAERTFLHIIRYTQTALGERSLLLGMPFVSYADLLREQNRFDEARRYAEQGIAYCRVWHPMASLDGLLALARLEAGRGDWEACFACFDQAVGMTENTRSALDDTFVVIQRVRAHLLHHDLAAADYWSQAYRIEAEALRMYRHLQELVELIVLRGALLRAERDPAHVAADLAARLPDIERFERISPLIEALILRAYALHAAGRAEETAASLERALELGARCGYVRIFADEGDQLYHLLQLYRPCRARVAVDRLIDKILGLISPPGLDAASPPPSIPARAALLPELTPLTRRELDILQHLAAGKSNQEIAAECVLALNTVKKHVANILSKLGAANRTQAVMTARKLGWIA